MSFLSFSSFFGYGSNDFLSFYSNNQVEAHARNVCVSVWIIIWKNTSIGLGIRIKRVFVYVATSTFKADHIKILFG
jgi:hypothetical protein